MQEVNPDLNAVFIDLSKQALRQTELADDAVKIEAPFSKKLGEIWVTLMLTEIQHLLRDAMESMGSRGLKAFLARLLRICAPLDMEGYMRALMKRTT